MNVQRKTYPWLLILLGLTLIGVRPALAQDVEVTSADPPAAEQGTVNLDVTIGGKGFERDAVASFLVTGTENPGGIVVNRTTFKGPKKLIANIDIDEVAILGGFDIEVLNQSSGRRGRGITLFAVQESTGNPGEGNQPLPGDANFFSGDIYSSGPLEGDFIEHGGEDPDYETLEGQLGPGETLTVAGDAGTALGQLGSSFLPPAGVLVSSIVCADPGETDCYEVSFDSLSGLTWTIRHDLNKSPPDRVQLQLGWLNQDDLQHHLRVGWVVQGGGLSQMDYGELTTASTSEACPPAAGEPPCSLRDGLVQFIGDPFRIDGDMQVGKGNKTKNVTFSEYGQDGMTFAMIGTSVVE